MLGLNLTSLFWGFIFWISAQIGFVSTLARSTKMTNGAANRCLRDVSRIAIQHGVLFMNGRCTILGTGNFGTNPCRQIRYFLHVISNVPLFSTICVVYLSLIHFLVVISICCLLFLELFGISIVFWFIFPSVFVVYFSKRY